MNTVPYSEKSIALMQRVEWERKILEGEEVNYLLIIVLRIMV